jgi:hypothetical protein
MKLQRRFMLCAVVVALSLPVLQVCAQNTGPIGPVSPLGPAGNRQLPVPTARSLDSEDSTSQAQADTHTLSSIERFGIGSLVAVPRYLDLYFHFSESGDTGLIPDTRGSVTSASENLLYDRNANRSRFTGFYTGTQVMYYPNSLYNNYSHVLALSEEIRSNRWTLRFRDDLLISRETAVGGLSIGGIGNLNGISGLQPVSGAGESILTQRAQRIKNATSGEIDYLLSRRSTLTLAGSYASLNFQNPAFIDNRAISGRTGYDYQLSEKDRIGLIYDYTQTHFSIAVPRMRTDSVQLAFGRKITGRLALQISGGPQQLRFGIYGDRLGWILSNAVSYETRRTQYSFGYAHTSSSGSGIFSGANSHVMNGSVQRTLTRSWSGSMNVAYAFNKTLAPVDGQFPAFGNWSANAALQHAIGPHLHIGFGYAFQQQNTGNGACASTGCGVTALRQVAGVSLDWRPFGIGAR